MAFPLADGAVGLVSAGQHGVRAWDLGTGEQTTAFDELNPEMTNGLEVCRRDGRDPVLAVATESGLEWFDAVTGAPRFGPTSDDTIAGLATGPGPDGREVLYGASFSGPSAMHRWDTGTGAMLADLGKERDHVVAIATFTLPDGTALVASGGWEETIHRWEPASGRAYGEPLVGHESGIGSIVSTPHPDGRLLLASADITGVVIRWDGITGERIGTPIRLDNEYNSILLVPAPGGPFLLTSSFDEEVIRRWDAVTGQPLGEFGHGFHPILFTMNRTMMMAAASSNGILVRPVEPVEGDPTFWI